MDLSSHVRVVSSFHCKANSHRVSMMKAAQRNITFKNPAEIIVSTMRHAVGLKGHCTENQIFLEHLQLYL